MPDALSRNPWDMQVDTTIVNSIINEERSTQTPLYESYGPNTNLLHPKVVIAKKGYVTGIVPPELERAKATMMTREDWIAVQKQDPVLNQLITLIKSKTLGHRKHHANDSSELKSMLRIKNQLILRKGLLFRKMKKGNQEGSVLEFVVPRKFRTQLLKACHVGHARIWKCIRLLRKRFYWANINQDMEQHIKRCERCIRFKAKLVNCYLLHVIIVFIVSSLYSCKSYKQVEEMVILHLFIDYHYKSIVSIIRERHVLTLHLSTANCRRKLTTGSCCKNVDVCCTHYVISTK